MVIWSRKKSAPKHRLLEQESETSEHVANQRFISKMAMKTYVHVLYKWMCKNKWMCEIQSDKKWFWFNKLNAQIMKWTCKTSKDTKQNHQWGCGKRFSDPRRNNIHKKGTSQQKVYLLWDNVGYPGQRAFKWVVVAYWSFITNRNLLTLHNLLF